MKQDASKQEEDSFIPPVSAFAGPIAELVGHRLLSPPTRPGLLASLARYEVVRVLGGGGMGVVVLAHDAEKGSDAAIKLIRPELVTDQKMVHRFVKEAGHLQKLKHRNVVPVLEISDRPEGPYFVMPYFERGSLANRIRPGEPLESTTVLDIARQVADGLGFAHRHGIIHRDLKPANILLGADGMSCLADFGLARTLFNDSIVDVEREQLEGTAPYMSPGVAAGNAEDTRCDIYSFGALLYEMLTGEPPYAGRNTNDIRQQILAGPPKPIKARNPEADAGLAAVAEGAMARELRDRYADMADVLADLDRIKAGKAVVGPRGLSGRVKQTSKWVPAGIIMIGLGLWLMWPSAPEKPAGTHPPAPTVPSNAPHMMLPTSVPVTNPVQAPPTPKPAPEPASIPWGLTLFAGRPGAPGSADGAAADARFKSPGGIAVDRNGVVFVADTGNNLIRKIAPDGTVSTLAGLAGHAGRSDGAGGEARFLAPMGIAVGPAGNIYVAEFANDTIRRITPDGVVSTLAGSAGNPGGADGTGDNAHFRNPWSVAVDSTGNVYVADRSNFAIRLVTPNGRVSVFAGIPLSPGGADGPGSYARFRDPRSLAVDASGNVYVVDSGNGVLRKISPAGVVTTLGEAFFGIAEIFSNAQCVTSDPQGNIYLLCSKWTVKIPAKPSPKFQGFPNSVLNDAQGNRVNPTSLAVDKKGAIYLVDDTRDAIWKEAEPAEFKARQP